jgi:hypothetical protein
MDVKKCQELDRKLKIVYKCARSLFNKIDKNLYFNLQNEKLKYDIDGRGLLNMVMLETYYKKLNIKDRFSFGFSCLKVNENMYDKLNYSKYNYSLFKHNSGDIEIGYFFPYHKIGDKIKITYRNYDVQNQKHEISRIDISDTNKIYLSHNNKKFRVGPDYLFPRSIYTTNNAPMYIIGVYFDCDDRNQLHRFYSLNRDIGYKFTYVEEASSEIIQKAWKNFVKRRNIRQFTKWTKCINDVNNELEYLPDFGIKYFEAKKNFECLSF